MAHGDVVQVYGWERRAHWKVECAEIVIDVHFFARDDAVSWLLRLFVDLRDCFAEE